MEEPGASAGDVASAVVAVVGGLSVGGGVDVVPIVDDAGGGSGDMSMKFGRC